MAKRTLDIIFSLAGLIILAPLFVAVALLIRLDSRGPVFFRQIRMGRNFSPFRIYKFRTMMPGAEQQGARITVSGDRRVTRIGHVLRKYKIDELPQLINVLKGDMSFVGPRPEVPEYVALFREQYETLLTLRPGITDPASLAYCREEEILASSGSWEEEYRKSILPEKISLSRRYVEDHTMMSDLKLISMTLLKITKSPPSLLRR